MKTKNLTIVCPICGHEMLIEGVLVAGGNEGWWERYGFKAWIFDHPTHKEVMNRVEEMTYVIDYTIPR